MKQFNDASQSKTAGFILLAIGLGLFIWQFLGVGQPFLFWRRIPIPIGVVGVILVISGSTLVTFPKGWKGGIWRAGLLASVISYATLIGIYVIWKQAHYFNAPDTF